MDKMEKNKNKKIKATRISRYRGSYSRSQIKYSKSKQERKYRIVVINLSLNSVYSG